MPKRLSPPDASPGYRLTLGGGFQIKLSPGDAQAARVVAFLAEKTRLAQAPGAGEFCLRVVCAADAPAPAAGKSVCRLDPPEAEYPQAVPASDGSVTFRPAPLAEEAWFWLQLARLSNAIAEQAGVMLHGGLAQLPPALGGEGVILGGHSGVGKSTASARLPAPWRSLCDDLTLVTPAEDGGYWAHPWPTWSRFFTPPGSTPAISPFPTTHTWDVQRPVRLRAIYLLEQGRVEASQPLDQQLAAVELCGLASQAAPGRAGTRGKPQAERKRQKFERLCALAQVVPVYRLVVRLDGTFWKEIERSLLDRPLQFGERGHAGDAVEEIGQ